MRKLKSCRGRKYVFVFNATAIIVLRELGHIDLIDDIRYRCGAKILIPSRVRNEFLRAGIELKIHSDNIEFDDATNVASIEDIPESLGEGERHAIMIAYLLTRRLGREAVAVVTDDKRARNKCRELGIRVIGTLGLIEFAKKHGAISKIEALELINKIPDTSLYITSRLLKDIKIKVENQ